MADDELSDSGSESEEHGPDERGPLWYVLLPSSSVSDFELHSSLSTVCVSSSRFEGLRVELHTHSAMRLLGAVALERQSSCLLASYFDKVGSMTSVRGPATNRWPPSE